MADRSITRKPAAILVAETVGYSRLIEADETGTIARQMAHRVTMQYEKQIGSFETTHRASRDWRY